MSEDIIRNTKEHEVVMPDGSINAVSKSATLSMNPLEPEHRESIVQDMSLSDQRISIDGEGSGVSSTVVVPAHAQEMSHVAVIEVETANDHQLTLPQDNASAHDGVPVPEPEQAPAPAPDITTPGEISDHVTAPLAEKQFGAETAAIDIPKALVNDPHAQVVASLADKWNEEYEGRVVKLREEVNVLNQRLDRLEK